MARPSPLFRCLQTAAASVLLASCATVRLPSVEIKRNPEEKTFTWKESAAEALKNNPDLHAAGLDVRSASLSRNIAAGDYLPSVDGTLDRGRTHTAAAGTRNNLSVGLEATENLFSGFGTTGGVIKAQKNFEAAKWFYDETSAAVRFRLRSSYIELLRLERLVEVNRRIAERQKSNAELIRLRYEAGREQIGSAMRADANREQALYDIRQTERLIESESVRFGRELGGDFSMPLRLDGDLEQLLPQVSEPAPDIPELAERSPQVKELMKAAEAAKANITAVQSVVWPKVDGSYDYDYAGDRASNLDNESFLGLRIRLPFFNGGKNTAAILKAKADYEAASERARSRRDETVAQLSEAWSSLAGAIELVRVQRQFLDASRKRSEIVRAQYSSGLSNFQEFDQAERDLTQSEKAYVQSLADALSQEANWELLKGSTLEDVLREK